MDEFKDFAPPQRFEVHDVAGTEQQAMGRGLARKLGKWRLTNDKSADIGTFGNRQFDVASELRESTSFSREQ